MSEPSPSIDSFLHVSVSESSGSLLASGLRGIFCALFPLICPLCGELLHASDDVVCGPCRTGFDRVGSSVCRVCGRPGVRIGRGGCRRCPEGRLHFESARSAFFYRGRMAEAVQLFKYNQRYELGRMLARAMFMGLEQGGQDSPGLDLLVPVPMHFWRLMRRGYNHAAVLAEEYARLAGVPWDPRVLVRIRHTPRQSLLPPERRATNVLGAFEVLRPEVVRERRIGLVDDVLTTAHTVNECARTLMDAGAGSVQVLTLSRA